MQEGELALELETICVLNSSHRGRNEPAFFLHATPTSFAIRLGGETGGRVGRVAPVGPQKRARRVAKRRRGQRGGGRLLEKRLDAVADPAG